MAPADERPVPHRSDALGSTLGLYIAYAYAADRCRSAYSAAKPAAGTKRQPTRSPMPFRWPKLLSARLLPYLHHAVAHEHRHGYRSGRKRRIHRVLPLHRTLRTLPRGLEPRRRHQPLAGKGFAGPAHRTDAPCRPAHLPADDRTGGGGIFRTDIQRLRLRIGLAALPHTRPA